MGSGFARSVTLSPRIADLLIGLTTDPGIGRVNTKTALRMIF
jgi:hypothetical protein